MKIETEKIELIPATPDETRKVEIVAATPDEGKRFVSRTDKVVADGGFYLPNAEAISEWEELDEAEALALKEQWEKEAEESLKNDQPEA